MTKNVFNTRKKISLSLATVALGSSALAHADDERYFIPQLLGAQYTLIQQHQDALNSPYAGPLSLHPDGDTARSHTFGAYLGVPLSTHLQFYFDLEMFKGEGVSGSTGLGGLTNGDVIRSGTATLGKRPYVARRYLRYVVPFGDETADVERALEQLPGKEFVHRLEFKLGTLAASDDFDKNRYANSTRTQFSNWSLFNNTAWDFAADTRGYSNGLVVGWINAGWALRYGVYQMPKEANGQALEWPIARARGENIELSWQPNVDGASVRLLVFRNIARMGLYREALAIAQASGQVPDIRADDKDGRRKFGYALNADLPLVDNGDTGLFARYGWSDGRKESFAFTEVDRSLSFGAQLSGTHWGRAQDHLGIGVVTNQLALDHRDYLAAGGSGFTLGDGRLNYGSERIVETYYLFQPVKFFSLSPDLQLIHNPGYNRDRGPARFAGLRAHLEY
ncbi:carbohydrate porin [Pseudolysobacter antarcticus]|uniref:Carbohydrate porin n=1 Tax=Pseudolysobacter antarcticus TaxID=2511995 RepID=A0A411HJ96_9GAMM|nr:carbohydrate porin [Pseudolysobacter antarcticus]QBB70561.1 carbohydrate porin [Pseudolysobacter antarcticus]